MKINGQWWMGDCLEMMADIPDGSVDMVLCDLPYGTTQNKWDNVIPFEPLWKQYWCVCKPNAAVVLTAQCPFDKMLGASQIQHLRYEWIWQKSIATGFLSSPYQPLKKHENILVFYRAHGTYNPQKTFGNKPYKTKRGRTLSKNYGLLEDNNQTVTDAMDGSRFPLSIQQFRSDKLKIHPTQKPVALFEYMIRTYTNEGGVVLDNTAGSGTTAIACQNTNRRWICIEQSQEYTNLALDRIRNNRKPRQGSLF